eukprot:365890-Chlamydomonas_euryale.AAC.7
MLRCSPSSGGSHKPSCLRLAPIKSLSQPSGIRCLIPLVRASTFCSVRQTPSRVFEAVAAILPGECADELRSAQTKAKPR